METLDTEEGKELAYKYNENLLLDQEWKTRPLAATLQVMRSTSDLPRPIFTAHVAQTTTILCSKC